jgi:hypothetical protein
MKPWLFILPLAALVLVALGVLAFQLLDTPARIDYYRLADDHTVIVGTTSGPRAWVRVTGVSETSKAVTITVRTVFIQLGPSTAVGYAYESEAKLEAPLGDRRVIDGTTGLPVETVNCLPQTISASPCP